MTDRRKVWKDNFTEWFHDVISGAEIIDYRYPIKGFGVWLPYGFKIRENVLRLLRKLLNDSLHDEMLFPILIPESLFEKESTHIRSFEDESFWVTHGGTTRLDVKLALRPTSETVITPMIKLWVRSHADLPRRIYQIGSVFRYETKATKPLIRIREVTTFKEAHTYHANHEEALKQVEEAINIYKQFFNEMGLPYVISERPQWDKFAGAVSTYAFDTLFPDGRVLQIGTIHDLGQNFGKAFDVTFETKDGRKEYVWQTSYGISERVIAALITIHGDDRGLIVPPNMAPIQVVIIPIPYKKKEQDVNNVCNMIHETLDREGIRVKLDDRPELTPGSKYYEWEQRGVPLRIEIGPRDVKEKSVTLVRRDTLERARCDDEKVVEEVVELLKNIQDSLVERASTWFKDHIMKTDNLKETKEKIGVGIVEVPWCGNEDCGLKIERLIDARVLGTDVETEKAINHKCLVCENKASNRVRLARAY